MGINTNFGIEAIIAEKSISGLECLRLPKSKKLKKVEAELTDKYKQLQDMELNLYKTLEKNKQTQYHKNQAEKKYKVIKQSRIWRYTLPLHKTLSFFKKVRLSKT